MSVSWQSGSNTLWVVSLSCIRRHTSTSVVPTAHSRSCSRQVLPVPLAAADGQCRNRSGAHSNNDMDAGYVVDAETGEKVLPGSRRPDGTIRKERRIRAGYVPQDEQPVYQSNGVMARRNVPKCPGLDPEQASAAAASAKSKAAKKNEKRKAKKVEDKTAGGSGSGGSQQQQQPASSRPAAAAAAAAAPPPQQAAAAAAADSGDPGAAALDRQIKALSKKVRQCASLLQRQKDGEALSAQEAEKVAKMPGWQEEIKELEHQLARLGT